MLTTLKIYGVPMSINAVKKAPKMVMSLLAAVVLTILVFAVAAMSVLGFTIVVQGWAAHPPASIHAPAQR